MHTRIWEVVLFVLLGLGCIFSIIVALPVNPTSVRLVVLCAVTGILGARALFIAGYDYANLKK
ncbi:MAG: hypothetical protein Q7S11_00855 [bacterium]|nr:hypothetical protein [bacterium]